MSSADLDPVAWTMRRYETAPLRMTFRAEDGDEALVWQERLREKVAELLGGFPAERGLAVVAIEPMGFGARRDPLTLERGRQTACEPVSGSALLLGETMIGWRVWDVMRAIDYIETRPDLDARRVGCVGISGGGTCALFAAALDPRIRCTYLSGYLNTFRASIMSVAHCVDNYVPGILNWAEMYDVAGLIAPRPLFSEAGTDDPIFPVAASRESFRLVKHVYAVMGAEDQVQQEIFEGGHRFHGERGWPFVVNALS